MFHVPGLNFLVSQPDILIATRQFDSHGAGYHSIERGCGDGLVSWIDPERGGELRELGSVFRLLR